MTLKAKPVPDGFHTVTAYLSQRDTGRALEFYRKAFGAETRLTMPGPDGRMLHAEVKIGDSIVFMADENPAMSPYVKAPVTAGCVTGTTFLYVPDVDAAFKRAVDAGAKVVTPLADMFWGDRFGTLIDPFGHHWSLATHIEDVAPQDMKKRQADWEKSLAKKS